MVLKGCFGLAVLDELDGQEEAEAAHVADGRMLRLEGLELFAHVGLKLGGALDKLEPLHLFDGGDGGAERDGMRLVGVAVGEVVVLEVVGDLLAWWRRGRAAHRPR